MMNTVRLVIVALQKLNESADAQRGGAPSKCIYKPIKKLPRVDISIGRSRVRRKAKIIIYPPSIYVTHVPADSPGAPT